MYKERIPEIYQHLSPGYRRIADFLLNSYHDAAFMTAAQVGRAADVDTTLVVRFAQRLGYPGFPELIADVQEDVKRDLRTVYEPSPEDHSPAGTVRRALTQDRNNLEFMLLHMDSGAVEKVVEVLAKASRIFVAGEGSMSYVGEAFVSLLVGLGFDAYVVSGGIAGQAAIAATLRPGDAVVGMGSTSLAPSVAVMIKVARAIGAATVGIVGSLTNPVASVAEHVLLAPTATAGLLPSWASFGGVIHGLVLALTIYRSEPAEWATRADRLLGEYAEALREQIPAMRDILASYDAGSASGS